MNLREQHRAAVEATICAEAARVAAHVAPGLPPPTVRLDDVVPVTSMSADEELMRLLDCAETARRDRETAHSVRNHADGRIVVLEAFHAERGPNGVFTGRRADGTEEVIGAHQLVTEWAPVDS